MIKKILKISIIASVVFFSSSQAGLANMGGGDDSPAVQSFAAVDDFFVKQYSAISKNIGQNTWPILVVDGFKYTLYLKDGTVKTFAGFKSPFNELKAVSHIGPALYAIAATHWENPADTSWKKTLADFQVEVQDALKNVDNVDWNNEAWPKQGDKLKVFMRDSLQMVDTSISEILQKGEFTRKDYSEFAKHYMHTMLATMYLADVGNTVPVINQLKEWKSAMPQKDWDNLYVVMMGSKGRKTAELTLETNTAAITISSLMKPENVKTHVFIMPMATTLEEAQNTLGQIISARDLAKAAFTTERAKQATGIYKALLTADVPLAKANIARIVKNQVEKNKIEMPLIGIMDKDKKFVTGTDTANQKK